jgi:hypothetical protein
LKHAVRDVRKGRPCNGQCRPGCHRCEPEARAWLLESELAGFLLQAVGIERVIAREWVDGVTEPDRPGTPSY